MIDPDFYVQWASKGAPMSANAKAAAALPDTNFNKVTLGDPAVVARVRFVKPLADETRKKYLELWQDVKTGQ
jgi:spermidine/putrescine transport system substrate-binding protein